MKGKTSKQLHAEQKEKECKLCSSLVEGLHYRLQNLSDAVYELKKLRQTESIVSLCNEYQIKIDTLESIYNALV